MFESDEYLRAIAADPLPDYRRLIFAEWLDRNGDREHVEFIRLQYRLQRPGQEENDEWLALSIREEELWARLAPRWQNEIPDPRRNPHLTARSPGKNFRCGIDAEIGFEIRIEDPLELMLGMGRWRFTARLHLTTVCTAEATFFANPQMYRVFTLNCERSGITDESLQPFAGSWDYGRLQVLDLIRNDVGPAGIEALTHCPSLTNLDTLLLDENRLGDEGVERLVSSPICRNLKTLRLNENGITDRGIIAIAQSPYLVSLKSLDLGNNTCREEGLQALAESSRLPKLVHLRFGYEDHYDEDGDFLYPRWADMLRDRLRDGLEI